MVLFHDNFSKHPFEIKILLKFLEWKYPQDSTSDIIFPLVQTDCLFIIAFQNKYAINLHIVSELTAAFARKKSKLTIT